jgi:hypothetical protein
VSEQLLIQLTRTLALAASALIECEAMKAANAEREARGEALAYGEESFRKLQTDNGLGWNQIMGSTQP